MFHRKALIGIELNPIGYKTLIEVLTRGRVTSIAELPYQMQARERGRSKASGARSLDFALQLLRLRKALREAGR
jgi:dolichol-phosphate mannosyltransferase